MNHKVSKNNHDYRKSNFFTFFFHGKKGMETWQLVLIILAVLLLLFFIVWYGVLNQDLNNLFEKFTGMM